jgi:hypothetical protein
MEASQVGVAPSATPPQPRPGKLAGRARPEAASATSSRHSNAPIKQGSQSILSKIVAQLAKFNDQGRIAQFTILRFESSRLSQTFLFSEKFLSLMRKARQMRAFLIVDSLQRPVFELFGPRTPESLQANPRKLPFSGDSRWRPGNESTAW